MAKPCLSRGGFGNKYLPSGASLIFLVNMKLLSLTGTDPLELHCSTGERYFHRFSMWIIFVTDCNSFFGGIRAYYVRIYFSMK